MKKIKCRKCGVSIGEDGRSFLIGKTPEKSLCYVCKSKTMTKENLQELVEILLVNQK